MSTQSIPKKAPPQKSLYKVQPPATCGKYKTYDDNVYASIMLEGMRVMLETGGQYSAKLSAMKTMKTANVIPRSTLISWYNKLKKDTMEKGDKYERDVMSDLALFDCVAVSEEGENLARTNLNFSQVKRQGSIYSQLLRHGIITIMECPGRKW